MEPVNRVPFYGISLFVCMRYPGNLIRPYNTLSLVFQKRFSTICAMYPITDPFDAGNLKVSDIHTLYYEVSGKTDGNPVVFLHGGPGGGTGPQDREYFNPKKYKIILFDQRGAGKSTPSASIEENTTWDLVKDIEKLREHLKIEKWNVFGGSWGSTLSLAYAQTHPERVKSLVLRGIFTLRKSETKFFYQEGASHIFPEAWSEYESVIPESERRDMIKAYHTALNSSDENVRLRAAKAWTKWEMSTSKLHIDYEAITHADDDKYSTAFAKIENHYFVNDGFMRDGQLLEQQSIDKIRHIPTIIIQGRYDVVCPATTAYALHKAFPEATFHIVPDAGHSAREPGISKLLTEATDKFSDL
ncbi:hypothetical protein AX15_000508 [Amanita polypyramis BW_CC]|nr:hypothetical protein AX15_000508 [Amanita polypyramis BW_CC]